MAKAESLHPQQGGPAWACQGEQASPDQSIYTPYSHTPLPIYHISQTDYWYSLNRHPWSYNPDNLDKSSPKTCHPTRCKLENSDHSKTLCAPLYSTCGTELSILINPRDCHNAQPNWNGWDILFPQVSSKFYKQDQRPVRWSTSSCISSFLPNCPFPKFKLSIVDLSTPVSHSDNIQATFISFWNCIPTFKYTSDAS